MTSSPEFRAWPKIARLSREAIVTEKIDGTSACVVITEDGQLFAQSRTRIITPENDNYCFAKWVQLRKEELLKLGPGHHFGEWYGAGIQRTYSLPEKRFALFNTCRWIENEATRIDEKQEVVPACCRVVPVLYRGVFTTDAVEGALAKLRIGGSVACPGFMRPEGVVVYHIAAGVNFKKLIEADEAPKGEQQQ